MLVLGLGHILRNMTCLHNALNPAPDILAHFSQAGLHALPRPKYAHSTDLVDHRLLAAVVDPLRRLNSHSLEGKEGEGVFND